MGELGGDAPVALAGLVKVMGKRRVLDLSVARNEVIVRGLLCAPEWGWLVFTVLGMHTFIVRQDWPLTPFAVSSQVEARFRAICCGRLADVLVGRRTRHGHLGRSIPR
jgi:hypothetical protein